MESLRNPCYTLVLLLRQFGLGNGRNSMLQPFKD